MTTPTMTTADAVGPELGPEVPQRSLWGPVSGIGFVALLIASFSVAPMPPGRGTTSEAIRTYFVDNASGVRGYALLQSLASVLFLLFVCWLSELVRTDARERLAAAAILGAGILTLAASLTGAALSATLASGVATDAEASVLRVLFELENLALNVGDPMVAALVGAFAFATARSSWMPRWLSIFGIVVAASWTLGSVSMIVTAGAFASPTGSYGLVMVSLLLVWVVAVSLALRGLALSRGQVLSPRTTHAHATV